MKTGKALSFFLASRYQSEKRKSGFTNFVSASSIWGIGLGVAVMIVGLSVMNGFEKELKNRWLDMIPHVEFRAVDVPIRNWQQKVRQLEADHTVLRAAPAITLNGMLQQGAGFKPLQITGIDAIDNHAIALEKYLSPDVSHTLTGNQIILGSQLAQDLHVDKGDTLVVLVAQTNQNFSTPKMVEFQIAGTFNIGGLLDHSAAFISLVKAQEIRGLKPGEVTSLQLKIKDVFAAPQVSRMLGMNLQEYVYMLDWQRLHGHIYNDIQMVRFIIYLALSLVIAVACFNIVSTLVMIVREKQSDIAILKTMGIHHRVINQTFVFYGLRNGLLGTCWGGIVGILLAIYLPDMMHWIESTFHLEFLDGSVYFIGFIPSDFQPMDAVVTVLIALVISFLATMYPSRTVLKIDPAVVLGQK
ncbi:lipoprotein-releasing ABC transporter permease subunit [Algicola sagamiensis]|uniref:lipoprotein-releasing ABC transporter permease subunit n=1 Tax=Algicola sagamiensis TaxID=163869 RepID=UPI00037ECE73|nr:lipoprotein-releasing ABC transporter permease subunit [Algicola sagamiensis]